MAVAAAGEEEYTEEESYEPEEEYVEAPMPAPYKPVAKAY